MSSLSSLQLGRFPSVSVTATSTPAAASAPSPVVSSSSSSSSAGGPGPAPTSSLPPVPPKSRTLPPPPQAPNSSNPKPLPDLPTLTSTTSTTTTTTAPLPLASTAETATDAAPTTATGAEGASVGAAAAAAAADLPLKKVSAALLKRGDMGLNWKVRWCMLIDEEIIYYKCDKEDQAMGLPDGIVPLRNSQIALHDTRKQKNIFSITTEDKVNHVFRAETGKEFSMWISEIMQTIAKCSDKSALGARQPSSIDLSVFDDDAPVENGDGSQQGQVAWSSWLADRGYAGDGAAPAPASAASATSPPAAAASPASTASAPTPAAPGSPSSPSSSSSSSSMSFASTTASIMTARKGMLNSLKTLRQGVLNMSNKSASGGSVANSASSSSSTGNSNSLNTSVDELPQTPAASLGSSSQFTSMVDLSELMSDGKSELKTPPVKVNRVAVKEQLKGSEKQAIEVLTAVASAVNAHDAEAFLSAASGVLDSVSQLVNQSSTLCNDADAEFRGKLSEIHERMHKAVSNMVRHADTILDDDDSDSVALLAMRAASTALVHAFLELRHIVHSRPDEVEEELPAEEVAEQPPKSPRSSGNLSSEFTLLSGFSSVSRSLPTSQSSSNLVPPTSAPPTSAPTATATATATAEPANPNSAHASPPASLSSATAPPAAVSSTGAPQSLLPKRTRPSLNALPPPPRSGSSASLGIITPMASRPASTMVRGDGNEHQHGSADAPATPTANAVEKPLLPVPSPRSRTTSSTSNHSQGSSGSSNGSMEDLRSPTSPTSQPHGEGSLIAPPMRRKRSVQIPTVSEEASEGPPPPTPQPTPTPQPPPRHSIFHDDESRRRAQSESVAPVAAPRKKVSMTTTASAPSLLNTPASAVQSRRESNSSVNSHNTDEDDPQNGIIFTDDDGVRRVKAGSVDALILYMTIATDPMYMKTFLMTYRSFITPEVLLQKLIDRHRVPATASNRQAMQLRLVSVIKKFIDGHWDDFSEMMMQSVSEFSYRLIEEGYLNHAKQIRLVLTRKKQAARLKLNKQRPKPPAPQMPLNNKPWSLFDVSSDELARQITMMDWQVYELIQVSELLVWTKQQSPVNSPNVFSMIQRFNKLAMWACTFVLSFETLADRVKAMMKLLDMGKSLKNLHNCNSLMAILSGLNNASISRLKYTRAELPKHAKDNSQMLNNLMDFSKSYANYRVFLHGVNPPCIPYLGVYLSDLTFINDGNPDLIEGRLIHFTKRRFVYNVLAEIQQYQQQYVDASAACFVVTWSISPSRLVSSRRTQRIQLPARS
ncbi:hypothetical protein, variant 1 [Capsaspora owczarzaki ATCC 30864]|uniref:Uncharacterized protein n=1 Tax=Capsaspora owczarzaki (strain ATCC 30864) TaxID=595528 RepID=A0A0D2X2W2_CAPO3|nr:hypothetical protein, variant 1 [Capsaspora owczarzaki ATCC 30864]